MLVRTLQATRETARQINSEGWNSVRMLLNNDGVGFSFHITTIYRNAELHLHYQNHFEAVYCISGRGSIEDRASGQVHPIEPGTLYVLDQHDQHILRATEEMQMACVFNPPLHGTEVHNAEGAYALQADEIKD
jgi:L-ectoine synthase